MSNGKSDLLVFLGAAFASLIGLAVLQKWYGSYIDIRYSQQLAEAAPSETLLAARREDELQEQKRKVPLDQAISRLARQGRGSFSSIAPVQSQDLSAIAGWIHRPGFKPVTAHTVRAPRAAAPVAAEPTEAPEQATATPEAAPAAPAAANSKKPAAPTGKPAPKAKPAR